ncbi:hypothetical protein BY996DRAFT_6410789 [Phakopsora pachyrhizi]|nr:hypothetical protein BY996DRAFT_6410789 [Phakopsora pachyrhizi]
MVSIFSKSFILANKQNEDVGSPLLLKRRSLPHISRSLIPPAGTGGPYVKGPDGKMVPNPNAASVVLPGKSSAISKPNSSNSINGTASPAITSANDNLAATSNSVASNSSTVATSNSSSTGATKSMTNAAASKSPNVTTTPDSLNNSTTSKSLTPTTKASDASAEKKDQGGLGSFPALGGKTGTATLSGDPVAKSSNDPTITSGGGKSKGNVANSSPAQSSSNADVTINEESEATAKQGGATNNQQNS